METRAAGRAPRCRPRSPAGLDVPEPGRDLAHPGVAVELLVAERQVRQHVHEAAHAAEGEGVDVQAPASRGPGAASSRVTQQIQLRAWAQRKEELLSRKGRLAQGRRVTRCSCMRSETDPTWTLLMGSCASKYSISNLRFFERRGPVGLMLRRRGPPLCFHCTSLPAPCSPPQEC